MQSDRNKGGADGRRGKLKVFLGAAAGVGKTYTMLEEAHRRVSRGEDIVVGLVETHGRTATAEMAQGLEQVPQKEMEYRDRIFRELDTDAVIARRPEIVIVDELAHSNIPGSKHEKRWQDVEEIREAGIHVLTTLNVQHLESLQDTVREITGVRVAETLPDSILDKADEIELVDLTPDALINRLKRGDIYPVDKVPLALANFFRRSNLAALRELTLQRAAEEAGDQLKGNAEAQKAGLREQVVVCVTPQAGSIRLVRRGYRLARRMHGRFTCLHVREPGAVLTAREEAQLAELFELARAFGGEALEVEGDSPAEEIIRYVRKNRATYVVLGRASVSRWNEIVRGSLVNRIMRELKDVDIVLVGDEEGAQRRRTK